MTYTENIQRKSLPKPSRSVHNPLPHRQVVANLRMQRDERKSMVEETTALIEKRPPQLRKGRLGRERGNEGLLA